MSIDKLRQHLDDLNNLHLTNETLEEMVITKMQLNLEIDKGERHKEKRARAICLRNDNLNTGFFTYYLLNVGELRGWNNLKMWMVV